MRSSKMIHVFAVIFLVIGLLSTLSGAIALFINAFAGLGVLTLIVGTMISLLTFAFMKGFADIIDNTYDTAVNTDAILRMMEYQKPRENTEPDRSTNRNTNLLAAVAAPPSYQSTQSQTLISCPNCGRMQPSSRDNCISCDKPLH